MCGNILENVIEGDFWDFLKLIFWKIEQKSIKFISREKVKIQYDHPYYPESLSEI